MMYVSSPYFAGLRPVGNSVYEATPTIYMHIKQFTASKRAASMENQLCTRMQRFFTGSQIEQDEDAILALPLKAHLGKFRTNPN
jgi:hypothetical protein